MPHERATLKPVRIAVLADIHSNITALDAVLVDADSLGAEAVWHCGDVVGYGPDPDAVIARLREAGAFGVMGNHDAAASGVIGVEGFNPIAAAAALWTAKNSSPETKEYLAALPRTHVQGAFTVVHGTLRDPLHEYLVTYDSARGHFVLQRTAYSIVGHTHLPLAIRLAADGEVETQTPADDGRVELGRERMCVNPGSVGQPRDGDIRASWALLDTRDHVVTYRRVAYDIPAVQERIVAAGLPQRLATRLDEGR
jgi:predicted phosphodiesterase